MNFCLTFLNPSSRDIKILRSLSLLCKNCKKKHSLDTEVHPMKIEIARMNMASIHNSTLLYSFCYPFKSIEEKDFYGRIPFLLTSKNLAQPPLREIWT